MLPTSFLLINPQPDFGLESWNLFVQKFQRIQMNPHLRILTLTIKDVNYEMKQKNIASPEAMSH